MCKRDTWDPVFGHWIAHPGPGDRGHQGTIFSAVNGVLIRPLPYPDPARLVLLWGDDPIRDRHREQVCYPDMEDWRQQDHVFEEVAAFAGYWSRCCPRFRAWSN